MSVIVKAPGSCGELVQGTIAGVPLLVTCPINLFSTVRIERGKHKPGRYAKAELAVLKTKQYLAVADAEELCVYVDTQLPWGKGMASSSADISAACQATAKYFGKELTSAEIAQIALSIEPTDGIFFPGIVVLDHINGTRCQQLGAPPPIEIAIFDCGGEVDTLYFNKRKDLAALNNAKEPVVKQALQLVKQGIATKDCRLIGQGATLSAVANQTILPKPCLRQIIDTAEHFGAVGVNIAHSGTVIGVMFDPMAMGGYAGCIQTIKHECGMLQYIATARLISGGLTIEMGES